ncbi:MAG: hypothetical protein O2818_04250 [Bacteroidetes bacterium]|nr:hypothetical protein [Bacteroidota bacterium]
MTNSAGIIHKPILPWKRPYWLLVLGMMLVFGFYQERAKVQLNHYVEVLQENPELQKMPSELREKWWDINQPPKRIHYFVMTGTWNGFHHYSLIQLGRLKWALSIAILLVFFGLDALFLRSTGHLDRWPWLIIMYAIAGTIMLIFIGLVPGKSGYGVAHEFLSFLQSPLPSLLIVLVPSLLERMRHIE